MLGGIVARPEPGCGCSAVMQAERRQAVGRASLDARTRLAWRRIRELGVGRASGVQAKGAQETGLLSDQMRCAYVYVSGRSYAAVQAKRYLAMR
jgi:hypothetical protein